MKYRHAMHPNDVRCHGTYAWDLGDRVTSLGKISREEAANLLGVPEELRGHEYMWLNKGWLVEGRSFLVGDRNAKWERGMTPPTIQIGTGEPFDCMASSLKQGDRIVYLADGNYYRLEVVK